MSSNNTITRQLVLHARPEEVWDALTNPEKSKLFMFNAEVQSDWLVGSTITWTGIKKGKVFHAKGAIIFIDKNKQLKHSYLELHSGTEDVGLNYLYVTYFLESKYNGTELEIVIENFNDDNNRLVFIGKTWDNTVLPGLKRMFNAMP
jgi:uncharacterized protein YndB with AHSA1/START domain